MVRVLLLTTCLLLAIRGLSGSPTTLHRRCYMNCKREFWTDCHPSVSRRSPVNCASEQSWCQNACGHLLEKSTEEQAVDNEQEYLSDDLKKRELDELKKLIGIEY